MNEDFDKTSFVHASKKRLKAWHSFHGSRKNDGDEGRTSSGAKGKDHTTLASNMAPILMSPKLQKRLQQNLSKSITPELKERENEGNVFINDNENINDTTSVSSPQALTVGGTETFTAGQDNLDGKPFAFEFDENEEKPGSPTYSSERGVDCDDLWVKQKLSSMKLSHLESLFSNSQPLFSDDESIGCSVQDSYLAPEKNTGANSMSTLLEEQRKYNLLINESVEKMKYAAKSSFPELFLPEEYNDDFFKFMEKCGAQEFCRKEKWTNVVNLMINYLLKKTLRHWAGKEENFPEQTALISLRNLFKMWYCNMSSVKVKYSQGKRGRGQKYSEEEILAIEVGMYRYPAISGKGHCSGYEFLWSSILADEELGKVLKHRTRDSIIDKVTCMCKEKIWDSLGFFYLQQQKLACKLREMKLRVRAELKDIEEKPESTSRVEAED